MYANSPKGRFFQALAQLGATAARGISRAAMQKRAQQAQADALADLASPFEGDGEDFDGTDYGAPGCSECDETRRELLDDAFGRR